MDFASGDQRTGTRTDKPSCRWEVIALTEMEITAGREAHTLA